MDLIGEPVKTDRRITLNLHRRQSGFAWVLLCLSFAFLANAVRRACKHTDPEHRHAHHPLRCRVLLSAARAGRAQPRRYDLRMRRATRYRERNRRLAHPTAGCMQRDADGEAAAYTSMCGPRCQCGAESGGPAILGCSIDQVKERIMRRSIHRRKGNARWARSILRLGASNGANPQLRRNVNDNEAEGSGRGPPLIGQRPLRPLPTSSARRLRPAPRPRSRIRMCRPLSIIVCLFAALGRACAMTSDSLRAEYHGGVARRSWNMLADPETRLMACDRADCGSIEVDSNHGPPPARDASRCIHLISANVHALAPRIGDISEWDADIVLLQETKLAAHSIKDAVEVAKQAGWTFRHGRPCQVLTRKKAKPKARSDTSAPTEANSSGVAAMIRKPRRDLEHELNDKEKALYDTRRWTKATTAMAKGKGALTSATYYGISGANSCPRTRAE